ncbi:Fanconi anemia group B protein [Simochromis diagramma]|uniref:Fanconi anemia group B protein n=1 Tax=Simochromis diagramma TaxID=43689 RepID=UPI001A7EE3BB|nr:Fanconi anemia group B protein [Simochromis diagramma]
MMESVLSEDLYRNPHRLSHCGKTISFNCKRAPGTNDNEGSELIFCSLSFEREGNTFLKAADGAAVISRKRLAHVDIVKCKSVTDAQKRATAPCVLVIKKSEKRSSFQYSLLTLSSSNRLEPCVEFKLPYQMKGAVYILQGPTVLWRHEGGVLYTSPQAEGVRQVPIHFSHCVVGELPLHKGQVFVLGLQKLPEESTSQTLGYFVEDGQVFDGSVILPHLYISITQCILVVAADRVDGVLKCDVVAATSNRQLVYFENGVVKDVCQLPFEQPENIQVVNTGRYGSLFAVSFCEGHVCTIWKETFQIAALWSSVTSIHVDDFLGCGTDQMLLVFKDRVIALEEFLITDLCGISFSHGQDTEAPKTSPPPPENYLLTLKALESRLQSGLTVLQELQREVTVKESVLRQSVKALTDVVSEREPVLTQHEQEGLIALWDSDDESKNEALDDKIHDIPAVSSKPRIDKLWHRTTEGRMVVGVILTTDRSAPVTNVSLSILTDTGQCSRPAVIQTQSQVFWLPAACSSPSSSSSSSFSASTFPEPPAKKSKQHNAISTNDLNACRVAVTAVTKLTPLLNSGRVKCHVMLHYIQTPDAFSFMSNQRPVVLHCGQVALDIQNNLHTELLKTPQLIADEVREDFLSLLAVLDHWVFHIDSPEYSLGDINGWIQKRVGCKKIEVSPQYLLLNSSGPSALMLLNWHQITPFQGELHVHSSQLQMFQFLDSLLAYLPESCSIQPLKGAGGRGASKMFALALEKELVSLREYASLLLCEEDEEKLKEKCFGYKETPDAGSVEGLQKCRAMCQRDLERSNMKLSPLVDVGQYRRLIQSMSKIQLNGDLAALLDIQFSPLMCCSGFHG